MPTSSQALIQIHTESGTLPECTKHNQPSDNLKCPVSKINIRPLPGEKLSRLPLLTPSDESKKDILPPKTPHTNKEKGSRGVYAFNPVTRAFSWQLLHSDSQLFGGDRLQKPFMRSLSPRFEKSKSVSIMEWRDDSSEELPIGRVPTPRALEESVQKVMNLGFKKDQKKLSLQDVPSKNVLGKVKSSASTPRKKTTSSPMLERKSSLKTPTKLSNSNVSSPRYPSAPIVSPKVKKTESTVAETLIRRLPRRMDTFVLNYKCTSTPAVSKAEERALFEEVKRRGARRKKKKYVPTMRMRKELPPPNPNRLCFNLYDGSLSHKDIKHMIESQAKTKILDLKFDPVYVLMGECSSQYKSMWVFSINDMSARTDLLYYGLHYHEDNLRVRLYDDVMREEHNAYKMYKEAEEEQIMRQVKPELMKITIKSAKRTLGSPSPSPIELSSNSLFSPVDRATPKAVRSFKKPKSHKIRPTKLTEIAVY